MWMLGLCSRLIWGAEGKSGTRRAVHVASGERVAEEMAHLIVLARRSVVVGYAKE
jgi:hypothetical protein